MEGVDGDASGGDGSAPAPGTTLSGGSSGRGTRSIHEEVMERLVSDGLVEEASVAEFHAWLDSYFANPPSYHLAVEKDTESLSKELHASFLRNAHFKQFTASYETYMAGKEQGIVKLHQGVLLEAISAKCPQFIVPTSEESKSVDLCMVWCSLNEPAYLNQITKILNEMGSNIKEMHTFASENGYIIGDYIIKGCPEKFIEKMMRVKVQESLEVEIKPDYHDTVMAHFHSILATEFSVNIPIMSALFAMESTLTMDTKVMMIFVFLPSAALAIFGLIMSSGLAEKKWQQVVSNITLYMTIFTLALFQYAMGLFFPSFDPKSGKDSGSPFQDKDLWYLLANFGLFLVGAFIIIFLWKGIFIEPKAISRECARKDDIGAKD